MDEDDTPVVILADAYPDFTTVADKVFRRNLYDIIGIGTTVWWARTPDGVPPSLLESADVIDVRTTSATPSA